MVDFDQLIARGQIVSALIIIAFALLMIADKKISSQKDSKTVEHKLRK